MSNSEIDLTLESDRMCNKADFENNNKGVAKMRMDRQVSEIHKIRNAFYLNNDYDFAS